MNLDLASILVPLNKIATGNDSCVYRHADTAIKEYHTASLDHVREYAGAMNRCVSLIGQVNYQFFMPIFGERYRVEFQGIPVEQVTTSPGGRPVTFSSYVPEPNLDRLTSREDHFATYSPRDHDARKWQFFHALNAHFNSERPTRLRDEVEYHLCMLSRILDFHLGTFGLYIGKYNVKPQPDFSSNRLTLIVTDVAVYLSRVVHSKDYYQAIKAAESLAAQTPG